MKLNLSAERIKELCAPPAGYVRPEPKPEAPRAPIEPVKRRKLDPNRKYSIKKETMLKIQEWRKTHQHHTYQEIANHFKVGLNTAYYSLNPRKTNAS